jgi:hypothetical protein
MAHRSDSGLMLEGSGICLKRDKTGKTFFYLSIVDPGEPRAAQAKRRCAETCQERKKKIFWALSALLRHIVGEDAKLRWFYTGGEKWTIIQLNAPLVGGL